MEDILVKFLIIISLLFFIPKVLFKLKKIPTSITEIFLGILLGILFPAFFFIDDVIRVLGALGIITIFLVGGMETDLPYILKNKKYFLESILLQFILIIIVSIITFYIFKQTFQVSLIISLALMTPSAGFIFSLLTHSEESHESKKLIQSTVICLEILSLLLLLIFLNLGSIITIVIGIISILLIIFLLPIILQWLYEHMFKKIFGAEFSFIFVVALISAYITEWIGVHFIIGAFVAGIVSKQFLDKINNGLWKMSPEHSITQSFVFFSHMFAPFYFFSIGLMFTLELLNLKTFLLALAAFIIVMGLRFLPSFIHHKFKGRKHYQSINLSIIILPTLLFTFVITELLNTHFKLEKTIIGAILIYGILASTIPLFFLNNQKTEEKF